MTNKVKNFVFIFAPPVISLVIGFLLSFYGQFKVNSNSLISIASSSICSFSLTSSILLLTMPRSNNKYLERIDKDNFTFKYFISVLTPGCLSLLAVIFNEGLFGGNSVSYLLPHSLFFGSILTLFWALLVFKLIIDRANNSGTV